MKMYVTLDTLGGYIVADQHMNTSGAHANWNLVAPVQIYMDGQAPVSPIESSEDSVFGLVSDAAGSSDSGSDITVNDDDDSSDNDNGGTSISVDDGSGSSDTGSSGGGTAINVVSGN
jgi:hypothetical protein